MNETAVPGWLHAALHSADATYANDINISFTLEVWTRVPGACARSASASDTVSFVLASADYAVALRDIEVPDDGASASTTRAVWPLFFGTAAPPQKCVAGPLVLTASTGAIGDGPGLLPRYESEGALSCSWILAPGGGSGGGSYGSFRDVTLFFTEFLLTNQDSLELASCLDINCTSTTEPTVFQGASVPPPFVSTTPVMLVTLTNYGEAWASSAGFTASYAGTPVLPAAMPGLTGNVWHHIALSVTASGRLSLVINGTEQLDQQLPCRTRSHAAQTPRPLAAAPPPGRTAATLGTRASRWTSCASGPRQGRRRTLAPR